MDKQEEAFPNASSTHSNHFAKSKRLAQQTSPNTFPTPNIKVMIPQINTYTAVIDHLKGQYIPCLLGNANDKPSMPNTAQSWGAEKILLTIKLNIGVIQWHSK